MSSLSSGFFRNSTALLVLCSASALCLSGCASVEPIPVDSTSIQDLKALSHRVHVVSRQAQVNLVRDVTGDYTQHARVASELVAYAAGRYPQAKTIFGIYPDDPDAVGASRAHWSLGMVLRPGDEMKGLATPSEGFRLEVIPAGLSMVLESTLGHSRRDGLLLNAWLPLSGYVQVGPTRVDYLTSSGDSKAAVQIVLPVRARVEAAL